MIRIDFETRSTLNLLKTGAPKYAAHPSTDVHCMAWKIDDGPTEIWIPAEECPFDPSGHVIEAHNAMFERCIWHFIMVERFGWPVIEPSQWRCSASRAAAMSLPRSLGQVGVALGLEKQKDESGRAVMLKLARPRKPSKNNSAVWHFSGPDYRKLRAYCMDDVEAEYHIGTSDDVYELSLRELRLWQYDQTINIRGIPIDVPTIKTAIKLIKRWERVLINEIRVITDGHISNLNQVARIVEWCSGRGVHLPNLQKQTVSSVLKRPNLPVDVRTVLRGRQSLGKSSTAKLDAMLEAVDDDGRVRDTLMYHGAGTGRWTGRRIQPHNYPKPEGIDQERAIELIAAGDLKSIRHEFGDPMNTISRCLRGMFLAPDGKVFYGADYSKIELCVLLWMANQYDVLEMLRNNEDVYVYQAMQIYNCMQENVDGKRRDIGKRGVLGCGYGCGPATLKTMVYTDAGLIIEDELAQKVVDGYRTMFYKVPRFWKTLNRCVMDVVQTGDTAAIGQLRWGVKGNYLHCRLPSGRLLSYYKPRIEFVETPWGAEIEAVTYMSADAITKQWIRDSTYGGKLTGEVTQAIARDLLAEAIPRAEKAKYSIVWHVHDEAVAETDEGFGSVEEFEHIMGVLPAWAKGCPVKAEGWTAKRYIK